MALRATAAPAAALAHADRTQATPTAKGPPAPEVLVGLDVQRCAGVDERIEGRQMAVGHRIVERRPPFPVQARLGSVRVAQRVPAAYRPIPPLAQRVPVYSLFLEPTAARGPEGTGRTRAYIQPATRAAASRGTTKILGGQRGGKRTATRKVRKMGTLAWERTCLGSRGCVRTHAPSSVCNTIIGTWGEARREWAVDATAR